MASLSVCYHDEDLSKEISTNQFRPEFADTPSCPLNDSHTRELKVDKRILQIMQKGGNQEVPSSETFFNPIIQRGVEIDLSTSFRDRQGNEIPIVKVSSPNTVELERACATIMEFLDPHRDKMTFNIDVPSSDHSFIIGKDGVRIKQLSRDTNCHIHLPDCNKALGKKSNKISIAGTCFQNIELARDSIRKNLPLNIQFTLNVDSNKISLFDSSSSEIQSIKRRHVVDVNFYGLPGFNGSNSQPGSITVSVKGNRSQLGTIFEAIREIFKLAYGIEYCQEALEFEIAIDISHIHHQYVRGKNNCNLKVIYQRCGANIVFPTDKSNIVRIQSRNINRVVMGWQEIMGYLPLMLSFDLNLDEHLIKQYAAVLERKHSISIRCREKLISTIYTLFIKTQERHSLCLNEIREQFMAIKKNAVLGTELHLSNSFFQEPLALASTSQTLPTINGTINTFTFPVGQRDGSQASTQVTTSTAIRSFGTNISNIDRSQVSESSTRHLNNYRSVFSVCPTSSDSENQNPFQFSLLEGNRQQRYNYPPGFGHSRSPTSSTSGLNVSFRPSTEAVSSSPLTDHASGSTLYGTNPSHALQDFSNFTWFNANKENDSNYQAMFSRFFNSSNVNSTANGNETFGKRSRFDSMSKGCNASRRLFSASPTNSKPSQSGDNLLNFPEDDNQRKTVWKPPNTAIQSMSQSFSRLGLQSINSKFSSTPLNTSSSTNMFKNMIDGNIKNNMTLFSNNSKNGNYNYNSRPNSYQDYESNLRLTSDDILEPSPFSTTNVSQDSGLFCNSFSIAGDMESSSRSSSRETTASDAGCVNTFFPYLNIDSQNENTVPSLFP